MKKGKHFRNRGVEQLVSGMQENGRRRDRASTKIVRGSEQQESACSCSISFHLLSRRYATTNSLTDTYYPLSTIHYPLSTIHSSLDNGPHAYCCLSRAHTQVTKVLPPATGLDPPGDAQADDVIWDAARALHDMTYEKWRLPLILKNRLPAKLKPVCQREYAIAAKLNKAREAVLDSWLPNVTLLDAEWLNHRGGLLSHEALFNVCSAVLCMLCCSMYALLFIVCFAVLLSPSTFRSPTLIAFVSSWFIHTHTRHTIRKHAPFDILILLVLLSLSVCLCMFCSGIPFATYHTSTHRKYQTDCAEGHHSAYSISTSSCKWRGR